MCAPLALAHALALEPPPLPFAPAARGGALSWTPLHHAAACGAVDAAAALEIAERAVATAAVRDAYSGGLLNLCVAEKGAEGWRRLLRRHAPVLLNT